MPLNLDMAALLQRADAAIALADRVRAIQAHYAGNSGRWYAGQADAIEPTECYQEIQAQMRSALVEHFAQLEPSPAEAEEVSAALKA